MKDLLCILILVAPSVSWKLWKDRNGVQHPAYKEVEFFPIIWFIGYVFCGLIEYSIFEHNKGLFILKCFLISFTGHGFLFTYAFNSLWWLKNNPHSYFNLNYVLNHLSDSAIPDKWQWWRACGWLGRLLIYITLFSLSVIWFVL